MHNYCKLSGQVEKTINSAGSTGRIKHFCLVPPLCHSQLYSLDPKNNLPCHINVVVEKLQRYW